MKTPLTEAIAAADSRGAYLGNTEMQAIFGRMSRAQAGLNAAKAFNQNGQKWSEAAANHVYQNSPTPPKCRVLNTLLPQKVNQNVFVTSAITSAPSAIAVWLVAQAH